MTDSIGEERFLETMRKDRCPVCFLTSMSEVERLRSFLNEYVNDPDVRKRVSRSGGFCHRHAWMSVTSGNNPMGVGLVHHALLNEGLDSIEKDLLKPALFKTSRKKEECMVCTWKKHVEDNLSHQFAGAWARSPKLREEFDKNGILCIPHLEKAVRAASPREARAGLMAAGRKALEGLLGELSEFLAKQDHLRSGERSGEEWDAWIRAVHMMVGEKGTG
jgi:hypothetical protein